MGNASICWEFITVVSYQYVEEWQWRKCCNHRFPRVKHFLLIENKKLINQFEIWIWTRKTEVLVFVKQNTETRVREKKDLVWRMCNTCSLLSCGRVTANSRWWRYNSPMGETTLGGKEATWAAASLRCGATWYKFRESGASSRTTPPKTRTILMKYSF